MKISVIIIAHNEEKYIRECLNSIIQQTKKADEIILIAHNCIDNTIQISKEFPDIKTISYNGPSGITYARIEGLSYISGDIIICIDGDSMAKNNWIEEMSRALNSNNNSLVGSYVKFKGNLLGDFFNIFNKYFCVSKNKKATRWIWGPSFAFWRKNIDIVRESFKISIILSQQINLFRNPDDYWLALNMCKYGNIEVINKTFVSQNSKEISTTEMIKRNIENHKNGYLIGEYIKSNPI